MKMSPLPWTATYQSCCKLYEIHDASGRDVLDTHAMGDGVYGAIRNRDDAEGIVRSVNMHDELVEALTLLQADATLIAVERDPVKIGEQQQALLAFLPKIRAVLTKAGVR